MSPVYTPSRLTKQINTSLSKSSIMWFGDIQDNPSQPGHNFLTSWGMIADEMEAKCLRYASVSIRLFRLWILDPTTLRRCAKGHLMPRYWFEWLEPHSEHRGNDQIHRSVEYASHGRRQKPNSSDWSNNLSATMRSQKMRE